MSFENTILGIFDSSKVFFDEPMKNHTSFKVGGNADCLLVPSCKEDISIALKICQSENIPYYIMGNGSNLLVRDNGFRGLIIKITDNMNESYVKDNNIVYAEAGILLSSLANFISKKGLSGFEFASGIPGSFGGAVYMNAGAYDGEMKQVISKANILNPLTCEELVLNNEELDFGYRTSFVQKNDLIVLSAELKLEAGEKELIIEKMNELNKKRKDKQPLEFPSAGSTFKRPEGYFAGKLIMDSGLRGKQIGGAQVSEKHCGFVINKDNATANDIINLIDYVRDTVYEKYNVELEPEVRIIGE